MSAESVILILLWMKRALTDVESNQAGYGVESVTSRVPTLQIQALRKVPTAEIFYSIPEPVRFSADPNRLVLPPLQVTDEPRASANTYYRQAGANDYERTVPGALYVAQLLGQDPAHNRSYSTFTNDWVMGPDVERGDRQHKRYWRWESWEAPQAWYIRDV